MRDKTNRDKSKSRFYIYTQQYITVIKRVINRVINSRHQSNASFNRLPYTSFNKRVARNTREEILNTFLEHRQFSIFVSWKDPRYISCHGHERESVLLLWLEYCFIERQRVYIPAYCPNDEPGERVLRYSWKWNWNIASSATANVRVIGIVHEFIPVSKCMLDRVNEKIHPAARLTSLLTINIFF